MIVLVCLLHLIAQTITSRVNQTTTTVAIVFPVDVKTNICPGTIAPGQTITCTVTLTAPAPAGGFTASVYTASCTMPDGSLCEQKLQPKLIPPSGLTVPAGAINTTYQIQLQ